MEKLNKAIEVVSNINKYLDMTNINVPILNNLKILRETSKNTIFIAQGNGILEQFLTDGVLNDKESLEDRIKSINKSVNNSLVFYDNYNSKFSFKIYLQDIDIDENTICRQINAYFIDNNKIYQIAVAIGPFSVTDKYKRLCVINEVKEDLIVKNLYNTLKSILDDTSYIENMGGN